MKIFNKLKSIALTVTAGAVLFQSASTYAARCEYTIQSEWGTGFVAAVRITNDTNTAINGWSVNWSYSDGSTRTGGWNANFSGNNPYTATNVGWNSKINPGQVIEFGVQGNKGVPNKPAVKPVVNGAVCVSKSSSSITNSSVPVRTSSSSSSRSSKWGCNDYSSCAASTSPKSTSSSSRASSLTSSNSQTSSSAIFATSSSYSTSSYDRCQPYDYECGLSSSSRSSNMSSSIPNLNPVPVLKITKHGLTVHIDASASFDPEGDTLKYQVSVGNQKFAYPNVWYTYGQAGYDEVILIVWDSKGKTATEIQDISVSAAGGNQAPIARIATVRQNQSIVAYGTASVDPDGTPLTYEWDFEDGPFVDGVMASVRDCEPNSTDGRGRMVTLTVSDGELKDTIQSYGGGLCGSSSDILPIPAFTYRVEGNKLLVDGRQSYADTAFNWSFGDGSAGTGVLATHTYAAAGTYDVKLTVQGPTTLSSSITQSIVIENSSSSAIFSSSSSIESSSLSSSSLVSSSRVPASSNSTSSASSSSSQASSDRNRYIAPRANTAPVIDGVVDSVWDKAAWSPIDVFWLGTQSNPNAQDYSGRYKALWDENYLYILYDVTDDKIFDGVRDPLDRYWEDDTVELFIDENKSGGQHGYNTSAWAYHVSTYGDTVDSTTGGATLLNDHIDVRMVSNGNQHYWEMRIRIYGEDYADWKANTPLTLTAGKLLGFSASYIDNDGSSQRESMMGSVDTQGHKNNQGYLDASVFGSMLLVD